MCYQLFEFGSILEPVLSHTEKSCISKRCRQFSSNVKIKKYYMFFYKTSSNLIIFHFNIHGKLSMRYITIPFLHIYCLCVILLYNNTYLKGVKKNYNLNQFKYLKILEIDPMVILVFDEACRDLPIDQE